MAYPATIDSFPTEVDGTTTMDAADINQHSTAIVAVETELGTAPRGSFADVKTRLNVLGERLGHWWQKDIPASQAATDAGLHGDADFKEQLVTRAGSLVAVVVRLTAARTAGTMTIRVKKNGVATTLTAVIDGTNTQTKVTTMAVGTETFVAGDRIGVDIATDAGFLPANTDDAIVDVEVAYT